MLVHTNFQGSNRNIINFLTKVVSCLIGLSYGGIIGRNKGYIVNFNGLFGKYLKVSAAKTAEIVFVNIPTLFKNDFNGIILLAVITHNLIISKMLTVGYG